jgi:hypothetical protein
LILEVVEVGGVICIVNLHQQSLLSLKVVVNHYFLDELWVQTVLDHLCLSKLLLLPVWLKVPEDTKSISLAICIKVRKLRAFES